MRWLLLCLLLLPGQAAAHELLEREDNLTVQEIDAETFVADIEVDFGALETSQCANPSHPDLCTQSEGIAWGMILAGQRLTCEEGDRNIPDNGDPRTTTPLLDNGTFANGKINGSPTTPLTLVENKTWLAASHRQAFQYPILVDKIGLPGNMFGDRWRLASISHGGCGQYGDAPWSMVLDQPRTAVAFDLLIDAVSHFRDCTIADGSRLHIEFWAGSQKIGHFDVIENQDCLLRLAFASTTPIEAVTTWIQNGRAVAWHNVRVGEVELVHDDAPRDDDDDREDATLGQRIDDLEDRIEVLEGLHFLFP